MKRKPGSQGSGAGRRRLRGWAQPGASPGGVRGPRHSDNVKLPKRVPPRPPSRGFFFWRIECPIGGMRFGPVTAGQGSPRSGRCNGIAQPNAGREPGSLNIEPVTWTLQATSDSPTGLGDGPTMWFGVNRNTPSAPLSAVRTFSSNTTRTDIRSCQRV